MAQNPEKWHLYMDESGEFEGESLKKKSLIFGLIVSENEKAEAKSLYQAICFNHGVNPSNHATENKGNKNYRQFLERLCKEFCEYFPGQFFYIEHGEDQHAEKGTSIPENINANRYLLMANEMLEYLIFLNPSTYDLNIDWYLYPNSRISPVQGDEKELGYNTILDKNKNKELAFSWTKDILRTLLQMKQIQYSDTGNFRRNISFKKIDTVIAKNSSDPFVSLVDNLVNAIFKKSKNSRELKQDIHIPLIYNLEYGRFKQIVQTYLMGDLYRFLEMALGEIPTMQQPYLRSVLETLMQRIPDSQFVNTESDMRQLLGLIDSNLRHSTGNWAFLEALIQRLVVICSHEANAKFRRYLAPLYHHAMVIHNHRGAILPALEALHHYESAKSPAQTMEDVLEEINRDNHKAVLLANAFQFEESNQCIQKHIPFLEQIKEQFTEYKHSLTQIALLSKLKGTTAQNLAFLAPRRPELFAQAQQHFLQAKSEFIAPKDQLRQDVYLMHLYLDSAPLPEPEPESLIQKILGLFTKTSNHASPESRRKPLIQSQYEMLTNQYEAVQRFLQEPTAESARAMQYFLHVYLKWILDGGETAQMEKAIEQYTIEKIESCFTPSVNEHPFELIFATLGRIASRLGLQPRAQEYFSKALDIPHPADPSHYTLQVIRAQILIWHLLENPENQALAKANLNQAIALMEGCVGMPYSDNSLCLDDPAQPRGWFGEGYAALKKAQKEGIRDASAFRPFLDCFTFNYK